MKGFGLVLMMVATLLMVGALLFSPTVDTGGTFGAPQQVYNLGALQYQELFFLAGVGSLIAGAVLYGIGELIHRLEEAGVLRPLIEQSLPASKPWIGPIPDAEEFDVAAGDCRWCSVVMRRGDRPCSDFSPEEVQSSERSLYNVACRKALVARRFTG